MNEYSKHCPKLPWMIDFYSSAEGTIPNNQYKAAFADKYIDYVTELNIESQTPKQRLTQIVCTIGPASCEVDALQKLMESGMTAVRIKMSHYTQDECKDLIKNIRQANDNYSRTIGRIYPLTVILDIKGPEIRTGSLKDLEIKEIELVEGNTTSITTDPAYEEHVTEDMIYVDYQKLNEVVEPGDHVYLDNGQISLSAIEIVGSIIRCIIENAGKLGSHTNVSLPGIPVDLPAISEKDLEDVRFAFYENVDIILISGVKDKDVIQEIKEILGKEGKSIMIFSKIENCQGINKFDEILEISDGIMICKGHLGIEIPKEKYFLLQKSIIGKCNKAGKPVICPATMVTVNSTSEVNDIANAVLDGVDCLSLSRETSILEQGLEAIRALDTICREAEAAMYQNRNNELIPKILSPIEPIYAIAISAVEMSLKCSAAAIIVLTVTGRSAKLLSKYRPRCPIIALTRSGQVVRQLHVFRALDPIHFIKPPKCDWQKDLDVRIQLGMTYGKVSGFIRAGDAVVLVAGSRQGSGFTNSMKVVYASDFDVPVEKKT